MTDSTVISETALDALQRVLQTAVGKKFGQSAHLRVHLSRKPTFEWIGIGGVARTIGNCVVLSGSQVTVYDNDVYSTGTEPAVSYSDWQHLAMRCHSGGANKTKVLAAVSELNETQFCDVVDVWSWQIPTLPAFDMLEHVVGWVAGVETSTPEYFVFVTDKTNEWTCLRSPRGQDDEVLVDSGRCTWMLFDGDSAPTVVSENALNSRDADVLVGLIKPDGTWTPEMFERFTQVASTSMNEGENAIPAHALATLYFGGEYRGSPRENVSFAERLSALQQWSSETSNSK